MSFPASGPESDLLGALAARRGLLDALADGPRSARELARELDVSRSTVDGRLDDLAMLGLVERDGAYRLTLAGRAALAELRRLSDRVGTIEEAREVIASVPPDAPFSIDALEGGTVHRPDPHAPNELFESLVERLERASRYRGFSGAERLPRLRELIHDRSIDDGLDAEVILTDDLAAFAVETRPRIVAETIRDGDVDVFTIPSLPYRLDILETPSRSEVFVVVYGTDVEVVGIVRNETDAALAWAERTYRRVRAESTPLDPPPVPDGRDG